MTRPAGRRLIVGWNGVVGLVVGIALVAVACAKPEPVAEPTWRFDCPDSAIRIRLVRHDTALDTISDIPLSHGIANVPEYHDCQRFIDSTGAYGSVYAIFAAYRLKRLDSAGGALTVPVGTIYTPDGTYDPLGIKPGFNCLWLTKNGSKWTAVMVHKGQGHTAAACNAQDTSSATPTGQPLEVKAEVAGLHFPLLGFGAGDYPPVARWDWDSVHGQQYIGIRCGAAWCQVGAAGFQPSHPYNGPDLVFDRTPAGNLPEHMAKRVQRIRGWYDVQRLAAYGDGSAQHPSAVWGTLIPAPVLDTVNWRSQHFALDFYRNRWIHVAFAIMSGDYGKWNLTRGTNKIFLCYGTTESGSCAITTAARTEGPSTTPLVNCPPDPTNSSLRWWARTVSAKGDTTYGCVLRMDHQAQVTAFMSTMAPGTKYSIPGAARWRFLSNDESTWVSCPSGCCTKQ